MKKLVMTVAVLTCAASFVSAQTVTSANIVGYAKQTVPAGGFQILAPQFTAGDAGGISLGDVFSGMNNLDEVLFWNGSDYDLFRYWDGYGWYYDNDFDEADDVLVPEGSAVWGKSAAGASTIVMAGQVPSVASITNTLTSGFNMVANPYPTALALEDLPENVLSDLDEILFWNGTDYDVYRFWLGYGWYYDNDFDEADTVEIPVGAGFWLKLAVGGDLVLDKQY